MKGKLKENQNVFIYAGASGVGSAAIQIASLFGAKIFVTCSNEDKVEYCKG